jgi:hypothetical protein
MSRTPEGPFVLTGDGGGWVSGIVKSLLLAGKPTRGLEPRTPSLRVKCSTS